MTRLSSILLFAILLAGPAAEVSARVLDLAETPVMKLDAGMTSTDVAVLGISVGMPWEQARTILDARQLPYLFARRAPLTVYIPALDPSLHVFIDPVTFVIREIWITGSGILPAENHLLTDAARWRLTTARTHFFGDEGRAVRNEEGDSWVWPDRGFALKYPCCGGEFAFVLSLPARTTVHRPCPDCPTQPSLPVLHTSLAFFITGYVLPTLPETVSDFRTRKAKGEFAKTPYVRDDDDRSTMAAADNLSLLDAFVARVADVAAKVVTTGGRLWFYVDGYTDEREVTAGNYTGPTIAEGPILVANGQRMSNVTLSWLRAWNTRLMLHGRLMESPAFARLVDEKRVSWDIHGLGVDHSASREWREKRRVDVRLHVQE